MSNDFRLDASFHARLAEQTEKLLGKIGNNVVDAAKQVVPVETGTLRDSIEARVMSPTQIQVGSDVVYAGVVELGSTHQAAQPYLRPAMDHAGDGLR